MTLDFLDTAIKDFGGYQKLAETLKTSRQAVYKWKVRVPIERVAELEKHLGVPREKLRPDIFVRD